MSCCGEALDMDSGAVCAFIRQFATVGANPGTRKLVSVSGAGCSLVYEALTSLSFLAPNLTFVNELGVPTIIAIPQYNPNPAKADGRLTLTTLTPVTTADVSGVGTLFYTPYKGTQLSLYDGVSAWTEVTFAEISVSLAAITNGVVYDVFAYNNAGVATLELLQWASGTARATALVMQNGVLVKSGATTRRYLGTIVGTGAGTTEDSKAKRYVWNYYNRVRRGMRGVETTGSWAYATAAWRAANNSALVRLNFVIGVAEDNVSASLRGCVILPSGASLSKVAFGLDSTTVIATGTGEVLIYSTGGYYSFSMTVDHFYPGIGVHYIQQMEWGGDWAATSWYGSGENQAGGEITGSVMG